MEHRNIASLPEAIEELSPDRRRGVMRIFRVSRVTGRFALPEGMGEAMKSNLRKLEEQRIVRVTNVITNESTLFNEMRARRPFDTGKLADARAAISETMGDAFCSPEMNTPEDLFGRVLGRYATTASNMAKYDHLHGVIIFREHDPLCWEKERIADYLDVAQEWFKRAHALDPEARYPLFIWNCLWRAGASIVHGHAQVLLSREPYAGVRALDNARKKYSALHGGDYDLALVEAHRSLGLALLKEGNHILAHLVPIKEREAIIVGTDYQRLAAAIAHVLAAYRELGVASFNLAIFMPPLDESGRFFVRIVDRGDPAIRNSDIGAMELYARTSVVTSDPFALADALPGDR